MARPKKNAMEKRDVDICVACSPMEIAELRQRAGEHKLAVYLRERGLSNKVVEQVPPVNKSIAIKLHRALIKINEIKLLAAQENFSRNDKVFWRLVGELKEELSEARIEVLTYADSEN